MCMFFFFIINLLTFISFVRFYLVWIFIILYSCDTRRETCWFLFRCMLVLCSFFGALSDFLSLCLMKRRCRCFDRCILCVKYMFSYDPLLQTKLLFFFFVRVCNEQRAEGAKSVMWNKWDDMKGIKAINYG